MIKSKWIWTIDWQYNTTIVTQKATWTGAMNIAYMGQNVGSVDSEEIALFHVQMNQSISVNYVDCGVTTSHSVPIRLISSIERIGASNACTAPTR